MEPFFATTLFAKFWQTTLVPVNVCSNLDSSITQKIFDKQQKKWFNGIAISHSPGSVLSSREPTLPLEFGKE
jgi:hypothetical protein